MTEQDKSVELLPEEKDFADFKIDYAQPNGIDDIGEVYYWACYWHEQWLSSRTTQPTDTCAAGVEEVEQAIKAIEFCLKVIHNSRISNDDNAIWSCGTSSKPRITATVLETVLAALRQPKSGE